MITIGNATLYTGNVLDVLRTLATGSVHCCVTSPPYYCLRDYGIDGQIGLEETPQAHICRLVEVFREVWRVLRDDGTLWVNYGDCYAGNPNSGGTSHRNDGGTPYRVEGLPPKNGGCFKPKNLMMLPARVAIALQEDGWYLRSEIIWAKQSPMPESVTDRPTCAHEKIFLLAKRERYFYDQEAVREKFHGEGDVRVNSAYAQKTGKFPTRAYKHQLLTSGRNLRNVWMLTPAAFAEAHFATFPPDLPKRCILAGTSETGCCPQCGAQWRRVVEKNNDGAYERCSYADAIQKPNQRGGSYIPATTKCIRYQPSCACEAGSPVPSTVLDPFSGAGTTAMVALQLGRKAIGIELNSEYNQIAAERIRKHGTQEILQFDATEEGDPEQFSLDF